jgi:hypothetical protein
MSIWLSNVTEVGYSLSTSEFSFGFYTEWEELTMKEMRIDKHRYDTRIMDEKSLCSSSFTESHIGLECMERECFEKFCSFTLHPTENCLHLMASKDKLARDIERKQNTMIRMGKNCVS